MTILTVSRDERRVMDLYPDADEPRLERAPAIVIRVYAVEARARQLAGLIPGILLATGYFVYTYRSLTRKVTVEEEASTNWHTTVWWVSIKDKWI